MSSFANVEAVVDQAITEQSTLAFIYDNKPRLVRGETVIEGKFSPILVAIQEEDEEYRRFSFHKIKDIRISE